MNRSMAALSCGLLSLVLSLGTPPLAAAGTCTKGCATITVSSWSGQPTLQCEDNVPIVKVVVSYNCGPDCQGTVTFYRCPESSEPYVFSCNVNRSFTVSVSGYWADALVECNAVQFTEN